MRRNIFIKTQEGKIQSNSVSEKFYADVINLPVDQRMQRVSNYVNSIKRNAAVASDEKDRRIHEKVFNNTKCFNCADRRFVDVVMWCEIYECDHSFSFACTCNDKAPEKHPMTGIPYTKIIDLVAQGVYRLHCQLSADCRFSADERNEKCGYVGCPRFDNGLGEYNKNAQDLKAWGLAGVNN